ncbi:MAG: AsmA-like C-terminal region-containing protein [Rikenellaceae bacterium]
MRIIIVKIAKWILTIIATLILLTLLLWGGVVGFIATPEIVTPHIVNALQEYTKSKVSIGSVDLSLFTRFPNITLRIDSLQITQCKDSVPDLIFAHQCRVAVNPVELLKNKHLAINHLSLRNASIYLYVDSLYGPLKTFRLPEPSIDTPNDTLSTLSLDDYTLSLRRFKIDSLNITIDDRRKEFYTRVDNYSADLSLDMTSRRGNLDVVSGFSNLIVWREGEVLVRNTALELRSKMLYDRDSMFIRFDRARIKLNDIDLKARGEFVRDTVAGGVEMDLRTSLNTPSLTEFLALVPSSIIDGKEKITTSGSVAFDMELRGLYSDESFPTIDATLHIEEATAKYESRKLSLERVDCDAYAFVNLNTPSDSYAEIRSLHLNTSDIIDLKLSGRIDNIIESPDVDLTIASEFNFDRFTELFPLNDGLICSGRSVSNFKSNFKLSDIQDNNYANLIVDGESTLHNLDITIDTSKFAQDSSSMEYLHIAAERGQILFGDNIRKEANSRTLRSQANFQDLSYRSKWGEYLDIKDIELTVGASFDRSTSQINGVGARGVARNSSVGIDSLFNSTMESSDVTLIVKPKSESSPTTIRAIVSSQRIKANEPTYNSKIELSAVDMNLNIERCAEIDSLDSRESLDSLESSRGRGETRHRRTERPRRWNTEGSISFSDYSMFSDLFPIDVNITESTISMINNNIHLNNTHLTIGKSDIVATGSIQNLIKMMLIDPRSAVSGELSIRAASLDFAEILDASNKSVLMMEDEGESESESTNESTTESSEAEQSSMFVVPRSIDFAFDLNIDKALFWESTIDNLSGQAKIKDGVLSLDKLSLKAIGAEAAGSLIYRNVDRSRSNVAADMVLERVDINRIGELLPSINSIFPMLESFEGIVDFNLKANVDLDKNSEIDISTLYSTMRFKGRNLVLMDGETFTDLSKTLMFKNKDRNLIDSVEIFALVAESKVDVLPFPISIDRYSAVVGGSQVIDPTTFDVDYNYQVSIIKSPLPFKAGVDVVGNLDNFDFKITKAKLKKTNFDEQRTIYEDYSASIEESESALVDQIEERRKEMRNKRREQQRQQQITEEEAEAEEDTEAEAETQSESTQSEQTPNSEEEI